MTESSPHKDVVDVLDVTVREDEPRSPNLGPVDLFQDADAITVTAETHNTDAQQVHVTLSDDKLFIALGEAYRKDVPLPCAVDEEAAVATFRNGVLDIVLPLRKAKHA